MPNWPPAARWPVLALMLWGCAVQPVRLELTPSDEAPSILDPVQVIASLRGDPAAGLSLIVTRSASDEVLVLSDADLTLLDDDGFERTFAFEVPSETASRGEIWTFEGRAETRRAFSTASLDLVFANAAPMASVLLTPASPTTLDAVRATVTASDPDGDPLEVVYRWFIDDEPFMAFGDELAAGSFRRGQVVTVRVFARDQADASPIASDAVQVANSPPGAPRATLGSGPVAENMPLVCRIAELATDLDGDELAYRFAWTVDGEPWGGEVATTVRDGDTVPAAATVPGQRWACEVVASDGFDEGPAASDAIDVGVWGGPRVFTPCGAAGPQGPEVEDCAPLYADSPLATEVEVEAGMQTWTAPLTAAYRIRAAGAQGGAAAHADGAGAGAIAEGTFVLERGARLTVAVGQAGQGDTVEGFNGSGGGGGGTFVAQQIRGWQPRLIAGGGGGAAWRAEAPYCGGAGDRFGGRGSGWQPVSTCESLAANAGEGGRPSTVARGAGGGGFNTAGGDDGAGAFQYGTGGQAFIDGAAGGAPRELGFCGAGAFGGFGGGGSGSGCPGGGGGGGYSGGEGGTVAGGGGSLSVGSDPSITPDANPEPDGWVVIDLALPEGS